MKVQAIGHLMSSGTFSSGEGPQLCSSKDTSLRMVCIRMAGMRTVCSNDGGLCFDLWLCIWFVLLLDSDRTLEQQIATHLR